MADDLYLTQVELARRAGIAQSTISRAYRGRQSFTLDQLDSLCAAMGVSLLAVLQEALRRRERR